MAEQQGTGSKSQVLNITEATIEKASTSVNPTITQITRDPQAEYMIYAIHGLQSDINTWGPFDQGSFRWLNDLSEWLKKNNGKAVDVSLIGWNTSVLSTANISTKITDTARPLAKDIVKNLSNFGFETLGPAKQPKKDQKVIFIGHSMGGILARALLSFMHAETKRTDTDREYYEKFLKSVCGVILLASPSHGSSLANFFAPLTAVPAAISGGMSTLVHNDHLVALKPSSGELKDITKEFEEFCKWFEAQCGRKLKVAALRETKKLGLAMVVKPESAGIPDTTKLLVDFEVHDLEGLNHVQVTNFENMNDPQLQKILEQIKRMQN